MFHVGAYQNEPPRPVLAVGGTATISGDPDLFLEWKSLYHQFDGDPAKAGDHDTIQNFRRKALRELKKIKTAWPDLNYATARGVLILRPSKPAIIPHQQLQLVK